MSEPFASPRFLPRVLLADAVSCFLTGLAQLLFTAELSGLLRLPALLLVSTGLFMLAYAGLATWTATRRPIPRGLVWLFVAGNFGWAAACAGLLVSGGLSPSPWGYAWVIAQGVTVLVLAELQWAGLRHAEPAGWA